MKVLIPAIMALSFGLVAIAPTPSDAAMGQRHEARKACREAAKQVSHEARHLYKKACNLKAKAERKGLV